MKIYGVKEAKGTYEGTAYHNVNLHCLDDDENANGKVCCVVKIKHAKLADVFGDNSMNLAKLVTLIGKDISVYYDQYKNPAHIVLRDDK